MRLCKRQDKTRRGMTLIEMAIVLGVVGLVSGAIWATADSVRSRQPINDTVQIVSEIAGNVQAVYSGARFAVPPTTIADQVDGNLFPLGVVNKTTKETFNSWGGTIFIHFAPVTGGVTNSGFSVEFTLPATINAVKRREACLGVLSRMPAEATNYAGGIAGSLPSSLLPLDASKEGGPALAFVNVGGWHNVSGAVTMTSLFGAGGNANCDGFAFYYRM